MSKKNKPSLVVDLGCGSGLSTRPWGSYAEKVIGIEPSEEMLSVALATNKNENVNYLKGTGEDTGLKNQSVDIVTVSSAIHWMKPLATASEIARILKNQGVLVIYGHYYPVYAESYELTAFHETWRKNLDSLEYEQEKQPARKYELKEIINTFNNTGLYNYFRRLYIHSKIYYSRQQIIGFLNAHAGVHYLKEKGYSDTDLLFDKYMVILDAIPNDLNLTAYYTYTLDLFIK